MLSIRNYRKAESLEEAWQLNQKRTNRVIGGMVWMKIGNGKIQTAIDLSGLGLDTIEETEEEFRIGCMVTLRQMELHEGIAAYSMGAVREALRHIVGVQFRNVATVGGSVYGRFGFSDVLTVLLAMDTYVELYRGGMIPLREFAQQKRDRDILVRILIKKTAGQFAYQSVRNTTTDFPVLTCAVALIDGKLRTAVGARPGRAVLLEEADPAGDRKDEEENTEPEREEKEESTEPVRGETETVRPVEKKKVCRMTKERAEAFGRYAAEQIPVGSNMRGSAEYRTHLIEVLVRRTCMLLGGAEKC